jgi:hypothetical protein
LQGRRPEELVLDPELIGSRAGLLLPHRAAVQYVDDFAAVGEEGLEDLLHRGVIRFFPRREADGREHFTGRRNGPLKERSSRLLKSAEQAGRERQRGAGANGRADEFTT